MKARLFRLLVSVAIAAVALLACDRDPPDPPPDLITARGVWIYAHGFPVDLPTLDAMDLWLDPVLPGAPCLDRLIVGFFSEEHLNALAQMQGATGHVQGYHIHGHTAPLPTFHSLVWEEDLWATSYVHEHAHHMLLCLFGAGAEDPGHTLRGVWDRVDSRGVRP